MRIRKFFRWVVKTIMNNYEFRIMIMKRIFYKKYNLINFSLVGFSMLFGVSEVNGQVVLTKTSGGASWTTVSASSGTDDQNITGCGLSGTTLTIGIENGSSRSVNLGGVRDGIGTDDQNITGCQVNGSNLTIGIENGSSQTISLAGYGDGNGIYGGSGSLSGSRSLNFGSNKLNFNVGTGRLTIGALTAVNNRIGILHSNPSNTLHMGVDNAAKPGSSSWTISSDERLKDIEGSYDKGLYEILRLNPITYHYKDVGNRVFEEEVKNTLSIGFLAQDVEQLFPECVGEDEDGYLDLNLHAVNIACLNAIKELNSINIQKKERNQYLKSELKKLQEQIRNHEEYSVSID